MTKTFRIYYVENEFNHTNDGVHWLSSQRMKFIEAPTLKELQKMIDTITDNAKNEYDLFDVWKQDYGISVMFADEPIVITGKEE